MTVSTSAIPYFEEAVSDSEITDSISSGAVSRSIHPTDYPKNNPISAEIVTDAMRACWYELKQSNLPDNLFTELMNCAVYSQKNRGLEEVSKAAISDFLEFWKEVPDMVEPLLTTTPNGGVGLEWFKDPDHVLAMMFPGNSFAIFNLFDGDAEVDGREPRAAFREIVAMLEGEPDFDEKSEVFRHIRAIYYQSDRRAKFPAFMEGNSASRNGLSVNSGEVQTINQVASIYAINSGEDRPVAISIHSVEDYNTAAARVSVNVTYDAGQRAWVFTSADGVEHAYLHDSKTGNPSHCLVRFTRHFDGKQAQKFAMRMAYKPRYTMV